VNGTFTDRGQLVEIMQRFASWLIRLQLQKRSHFCEHGCINAISFGQFTSPFRKPPGLARIDPRKR